MPSSLTREHEKVGEFSTAVDKETKTFIQDLLWGIFKKKKLESVIDSTHPPENLKGLDVSKVHSNFTGN